MTEHPRVGRVRVYRDEQGEWRFTAYATNGEPLVVSSEGYVNKADAVSAAMGSFALKDQSLLDIEG